MVFTVSGWWLDDCIRLIFRVLISYLCSTSFHISWKLIFLIPWHTNWLLSFNIESVQSALRTDLQYFYNTSLMKTWPTGDRRWMYLGKLLATLLLPGSLGWEQAQWLWSRAWRRVGNTEWPHFCRHQTADVMRSDWHLAFFSFFHYYRGIDNYLSIKQVTEYISDEPWGWYQQPPAKL